VVARLMLCHIPLIGSANDDVCRQPAQHQQVEGKDRLVVLVVPKGMLTVERGSCCAVNKGAVLWGWAPAMCWLS